MDFFEIVAEQRSTRAYLDKEVERDKLQRILEVANAAPSAGDVQGYEIIVIKDRKQSKQLKQRWILPPTLFLKPNTSPDY